MNSNTTNNNRRLKSFFFLSCCIFCGFVPHLFNQRYSLPGIVIISFMVLFYSLFLILKINKWIKNNYVLKKDLFGKELPFIDILVAARDEQNVVSILVERLFNLDYPSEKLNIYIIDDGSEDETPFILEELSEKYEKLKIISRKKNAGGGKSGALNYALQFTTAEWLLILDADAQLKNDTLLRLFSFANKGSWEAVQLRKSVLNTGKNLLTSCQSIEMAMDAVFQVGRLAVAGVSELRGNGQLIKKDILMSCGAFNEETVTDDLDLSMRLLISKSKIGILWDPPVMEEAVESVSALFSQRQRWAEGGLQRFFDYGYQLAFGNANLIQKFDLIYFFILQYALPIICLADLITSLIFFKSPIYWPITLTAFLLSGVASWYGSSFKNEGSGLPKPNLLRMIFFMAYLSHWFLIIPMVAIKMSIFPKKILWKKTLHKGV